MDYEKALKYAGKTAKIIGKIGATIVCPPVGLALWPKNAINKAGLGFVGVIFSGLSSAVIVGHENKIYDNPSVSIIKGPPSVAVGIGELFFSPMAFYLSSKPLTRIEKDKNFYFVSGDDIINFNNGKYSLSFPPNKKFCSSIDSDKKSVTRAEEQVEKYKKLLFDYTQKGDLISARRVREKLDSAKTDLEKTTEGYDEAKSIFQEAVDKMNSELECLVETGVSDSGYLNY